MNTRAIIRDAIANLVEISRADIEAAVLGKKTDVMEGKGIRLRHIEQVSVLEQGLHTAAGNAHDEIRTPACRGRDGFQRHVLGINAGSGAGCVLQEGIETDRFLWRQGRDGRRLGQAFRSYNRKQ